MDDEDQELGYPTWIDESVKFLLIVASCGVSAVAAYRFAQFVGWLPNVWWLS